MPVQFLDLDLINKPIGQVKIEGRDYDIYPLTVKNIVNLAQFETGIDDVPVSEQVQMSIEILCEVVKDIDRAIVEQLNMSQLNELMTWLQSLGEETATKNSQPALPRRKGQRR